MGGRSSKEEQLDRLGRLLSAEERSALRQGFDEAAGSPEAETLSRQQLEAYTTRHSLPLPSSLATGLYGALCPSDAKTKEGQDIITFSSYVQHSNALLKDSISQRAALVHRLLGGPHLKISAVNSSFLSFLNLATVSNVAKCLFPNLKDWNADSESSNLLVAHLTESLKCKLGSQGSDEASSSSDAPVSSSQLESWLGSSALAQRLLTLGLTYILFLNCLTKQDASATVSVVNDIPANIRVCLGLETTASVDSRSEEERGQVDIERTLVPVKVAHPLVREEFSSRLLDHASLALLNSHFPPDCRGRLYPLFSSAHHGESFSTFCKHLDKGPTLIVVRDTGGHVFGGFASEKWQFNPQFFGGTGCFLFSVRPSLCVYFPTGYNQNFMYLQQNAQTLPNGLGMGGQLDYFGLWLSGDYGRGHSKASPRCSTYGSPVLSSAEEFEVQLLELWGVGEPLVPEEQGKQPSILDKDKTAHALLEMAGKTLHSKDLREPQEQD